jgi:hypothetical protein
MTTPLVQAATAGFDALLVVQLSLGGTPAHARVVTRRESCNRSFGATQRRFIRSDRLYANYIEPRSSVRVGPLDTKA